MSRLSCRLSPAVLALISALALAGCKSAEERAEDYYQSGLALLEQGEDERAMIEFRNVFDLDGFHKEARRTYADLLLARGDTGQAYSQYLRLIEQYPDTVEVRQTLAELALERNDWDQVELHGAAALELAPEDLRSRAIGISMRYRQAVLDDETQAAAQIAGEASALLAEIRETDAPVDELGLVRVELDNLTSSDDTAGALASVEAALARAPDQLDLNMLRARFLSETGDMEAIGAHLEDMAARFPQNTDVQQNLLRWYASQGQTTRATAYLRDLAGPVDAEPAGHLTLVQFIAATEGPEAARAELEALRDANAGTDTGRIYAGSLAGLVFEAGETDEGIAQMRAALDGAEPGETTRDLQVMLAQMLDATGDRTAASELIETIVEQDPSNVEALKLRARWRIADDEIGVAISDLRTALNQNPQDSEALTLMAQAHLRDGDLALAGERLSLAVQVSNSAPAESIRYAAFLADQDRVPVAITVLEDARRKAPGNMDLLTSLAELYMRNRDWTQAQQMVQALRALDTPQARDMAPLLQAAILQGQNRIDDSLALLEAQVDPESGASDAESVRTVALIVQTQIRRGEIAAARSYLDSVLAQTPDNADLQMLDASLSALEGDGPGAEAKYRALAERFPQSALPVQYLANLLIADDRVDEAMTIIDAALPSVDDGTQLRLIKANILERRGETEAAIAVYEDMYAQNSENIVIANNLASMISTYRDDQESLTRAATIARRLRDTTVPAFADTYGWITFRRGNAEEALRYLELAASGLPRDPLVQFHLGMVQAELGQTDAARDSLNRAVDLGTGRDLPQLGIARDRLAALDAPDAPNAPDASTTPDASDASDRAPAPDSADREAADQPSAGQDL